MLVEVLFLTHWEIVSLSSIARHSPHLPTCRAEVEAVVRERQALKGRGPQAELMQREEGEAGRSWEGYLESYGSFRLKFMGCGL